MSVQEQDFAQKQNIAPNAPQGDPQLSNIERQLEAIKTANLERLREVATILLGELDPETVTEMKQLVLSGGEIPLFDSSDGGRRFDYKNPVDARKVVAAVKRKMEAQVGQSEKTFLKPEDLDRADSLLSAMEKAEKSGELVCLSDAIARPVPPGFVRLFRGVSKDALASEFNDPLSPDDENFYAEASTRMAAEGTSVVDLQRLTNLVKVRTSQVKWYSHDFQIAADKASGGAIYFMDVPRAGIKKYSEKGNPYDDSFIFPMAVARANAEVLAVGPNSKNMLSQSKYSADTELMAKLRNETTAKVETKQKLSNALQAREAGYLGRGVSAASFERIDKLLKAGGVKAVKVMVEGVRRKVSALENSAPLNDAQLRELNESRQIIWASIARELGYLEGEIDARALSTVDSNMFSDGVAVNKLRKSLDLPAKEKGVMKRVREWLSPSEISTVEGLVDNAMDLIKEGKYYQVCTLLSEKAQGLNLEFKVQKGGGWRIFPENVMTVEGRAEAARKISQLCRINSQTSSNDKPQIYLAGVMAARESSGLVQHDEYPAQFWQEISLVYLAQWIRALQYKYGNNLSNNASSRDSDVYQFMLKRGVVPTDTFSSLYAAQRPSQRLQ
ncbi:MAG: hypothetical protein COY80_01780 [Candidatus Pacebacteria bacterium CG_4_10_14_0_8_um_filter_42_14]|nr:MAG: hypothetical protein COY80_01780 [Candidatus Pacebacteria bacterium CG_4_10_14_0_8_um_filter_42_14]